ncbi:MAG: hypothetical protein ACETWT_02225 [Thermodesulfobacteriota bacterium]
MVKMVNLVYLVWLPQQVKAERREAGGERLRLRVRGRRRKAEVESRE